MARKRILNAEERYWTNWVIKNLSKNQVGFVDLQKDQRIGFGKSLLIISPKQLNLIGVHKGLVARANPAKKRKK